MDFEEIYNQYFNDVYRYIRRLSSDEHLAEEITSETFFKAMRSIDRFRGECDLRVWLCQIAKNCYHTYQRKSSKVIGVNEDELNSIPDPDLMPEDRIADHDLAVYIQSILHEMTEPYKEVFMWRVYAELSFKQIGQIYRKSENWACVTYHRARNMLKKRLEEHGHEK